MDKRVEEERRLKVREKGRGRACALVRARAQVENGGGILGCLSLRVRRSVNREKGVEKTKAAYAKNPKKDATAYCEGS